MPWWGLFVWGAHICAFVGGLLCGPFGEATLCAFLQVTGIFSVKKAYIGGLIWGPLYGGFI